MLVGQENQQFIEWVLETFPNGARLRMVNYDVAFEAARQKDFKRWALFGAEPPGIRFLPDQSKLDPEKRSRTYLSTDLAKPSTENQFSFQFHVFKTGTAEDLFTILEEYKKVETSKPLKDANSHFNFF